MLNVSTYNLTLLFSGRASLEDYCSLQAYHPLDIFRLARSVISKAQFSSMIKGGVYRIRIWWDTNNAGKKMNPRNDDYIRGTKVQTASTSMLPEKEGTEHRRRVEKQYSTVLANYNPTVIYLILLNRRKIPEPKVGFLC